MLEIDGGPAARRFVVRGELDAATADLLVNKLRTAAAADGDLELEMSKVSFVDSTGLRGLLTLAKSLDGKGQLVLCNPSKNVRRLLEITGVENRTNLRVE